MAYKFIKKADQNFRRPLIEEKSVEGFISDILTPYYWQNTWQEDLKDAMDNVRTLMGFLVRANLEHRSLTKEELQEIASMSRNGSYEIVEEK